MADAEDKAAAAEAKRQKRRAIWQAYYAANREKVLAGTRAYAEANREKRRAQSRAWREANPEKREAYKEANREAIRATDRAYAMANREKAAARSRASHAKHPETKKAWQAANREKVNAAARRFRATEHGKAVNAAYAKANPEMFRASGANRRARDMAAEGSYTAEDVKRIGETQKWRCHWCKTPTKQKYHVDHIVPLSKGGTNWPKNLCVACPPCNQRKHAADPIAFAQRIGLLL